MRNKLSNKKYLFPILLLIFSMTLSACAPLSELADLSILDKLGELTSTEAAAEPVAQQQVLDSPSANEPISEVASDGTLRGIYEAVNPSVVNIQVVSPVSGISNMPFDLPNSEDENEFPQQSGLGSGFVWDKQGHIITNNHVVEDASMIRVLFSDGREYQAELIGADADSDLAVLKIDAPESELFPVTVADSNNVMVGDLAIAIGNPFGLQGTMTVGIVSALGRTLSTQNGALDGNYTIPDIIQTDAAINPGNSGGVLLNGNGEVIGVTTAIQSTAGSNAGIGFVVPSHIVMRVVPELIENGAFQHSWLGLSGATLQADIAEAMDLDREQRGILIASITPDSPADNGGLRGSDKQFEYMGAQTLIGGDIIKAINGEPTPNFETLVSYLARATEPGQVVELTILRDGESQTVDVTLGVRPGKTTVQTPSSAFASGQAYLGVTGGSLVAEIAEQMDLDQDQQGVLVVEVQAGSPADEAGIRGSDRVFELDGQEIMIGGDVITAIDNIGVDGIQALRMELSKYNPGDVVTLSILRNGNALQIEVTLGERP
ncbi:MAG: trypsin-like peptidase domain-containing protein [Anaerolineaceae bacterium]|nr:trypsin-like peptidase domain-containing protein [Anaerolineaceae bacterium]